MLGSSYYSSVFLIFFKYCPLPLSFVVGVSRRFNLVFYVLFYQYISYGYIICGLFMCLLMSVVLFFVLLFYGSDLSFGGLCFCVFPFLSMVYWFCIYLFYIISILLGSGFFFAYVDFFLSNFFIFFYVCVLFFLSVNVSCAVCGFLFFIFL